MHYMLGNKGAHLVYGNIITCDKCGNSYMTQKGLRNHACLRCGKCGKVYPSKQVLSAHNCVNSHTCDMCQNVYTSRVRLLKHKCSYCKNCSKKFTTFQKYSLHKCRESNLYTSDSYACEFCKKNYSTKLLLHKHKCSFCKTCKKLYSTYQKYNAHLLKCVQQMEPQPATSTELENLPFFNPVTRQWQSDKCEIFNLQVSQRVIDTACSIRQPLNFVKPHATESISADGNCFFRALSFIITGTQLNHEYIRNAVVQHMFSIEDLIRGVMATPMAVRNYVATTNMNQSGIWATQVEIFTAANLLDTDIFLYSKFGNHWKWLQFSPYMTFHSHTATMSIYMYHKNQNHFEPVLDVVSSRVQTPNPDWYERYLDNQNNSKRKQQKSTEYREKENVYKQSEQYKINERANKQRKRSGPEAHAKEKLHKQSDQYKGNERANKQTRRLDPEVHAKEKLRKQSDKYKRNERENKQTRRLDPEVHAKEKLRKQSDKYKRNERENKQTRRLDPEVHAKEKLRKQSDKYKRNERANKQTKRSDPLVHAKEKLRKQSNKYKGDEKSNKKRKRSDPVVQAKEKLHKQSDQYKGNERANKQRKRSDPDRRKKEQEYRKLNLEQNIIENFHSNVSKGPQYSCCCCDQLWYKNNVFSLHSAKLSDTMKKKCLLDNLEGKEYICSTCKSHLSQNRVPPLSQANGVKFPTQPPELDITPLEERLVAARTPFMQLRELPRGGQAGIKGNVVNVPTNVSKTIQMLPRKPSDEECIPIKLKRRLRYDHHYMYEYVRPNKVLEAVKWLTKNSELYKQEGIVIDDEWQLTVHDDIDDSNNTNMENKMEIDHNNNEGDVTEETQKPEDVFDNDPSDELSSGPMDTLLQPTDILEDARDILSVAPSEGNSPVSVFLDKNSESLSFPSLYCGEELKTPNEYDVKVHYTDLCKSELRRTDRRVAGHMTDLFFKLKKVQMKHILDKASICMRKTSGKKQDLTAGFLKNTSNLEKLIHTDIGFKVFRDLRGSPPYWEKIKKDLFALIRFLGIPTWFTSFSSADTRWIHLLKILGSTVDKKEYTTDEVNNFSWYKKQELVKKDPVTCARHFDFAVRKFINEVLQNTSNPIAEVVDYFYKVEFQMRGSPHIHMLVWIKDAPVYEKSEEEDVIAFIDRYVTCDYSEEIGDLVQLQMHSHSRTCKKNDKPVCRFGYPIPPMETTVILQPLHLDGNEDEKLHKNNWEKISKFLTNLQPEQKELDFQTFLITLQISKEDYIKAVRSSISSPQVFLQRTLAETRVNSYNVLLLKCWRANMDIQYVLDAYSCAMYIVSYIAKSQRGMSALLFHAAKEAKEGNSDIREQVKFIGNKFLNNVELSAQEAVFTLLQMPLHKASRDVVFVNTSSPEKRTVMLKDFNIIENLPDDCKDVFAEGMLKHYSTRPEALENTCLADFVSWYRRKRKTKPQKKPKNLYTEHDEHNSDDDEADEVAASEIHDLENGYQLVRRQKQLCIRYVRFHVEKDTEDHYREILMLFEPWRDEDEIIGSSDTYLEQYRQLTIEKLSILTKMDEYNHKSKELDDAVEKLEEVDDIALEEKWNHVAPNTQHVEHQDGEVKVLLPDSNADPYMCPEAVELNIGLGVPNTDTVGKESIVLNMMKDEDYLSLVRSLNIKQREFFYFVTDKVKNYPEEPFHIFLTGGAGVGKTALTNAIYQMAIRYLNKEAGQNPEDVKVLLGAPTGKAAFLIGGNTLHHLFHIPANQGFQYKKLSNEKRNTMRCKFRHVRLLIIDECSMVGTEMFNFINLRLQEIMGNNLDFGGISVLAVGDFFQLKPVFDDWVFNNLKTGYGPLARNIWKDLFQIFLLDEIMRQKDDLQYAQLLNRLRVGDQTKEDIEALKTRVIGTCVMDKHYPLKEPHIFLTNKLVDAHNELIFTLSSECDKGKFISWDVVLGDKTDEVKKAILQKIPNKLSKTMGLAKTLNIALRSRVELSTNVDVDDGLANGASGQVMAFEKPKGKNTSVIVWINFDEEKIGKNVRNESKHLYSAKTALTWTPIQDIKRQFPVGRYKNTEVLRRQLPLRPASAKTAHRCQGDTMHSAVVDFTGKRTEHSHYVALSRVKSLKQLYIRNLNEDKISVSNQVKEEIKRLLTEKPLYHSLTFPVDIYNDESLTILFHNVRSLNAHFKDIKNDPNFTSADINIYSETKLSEKHCSEDISLPGYNIHRHDCKLQTNAASAYGMAVYSKVQFEDQIIYTDREIVPAIGVIESVKINVSLLDLCVIGVYASPKVAQKKVNKYIMERLASCRRNKVVILGDFNVDLKKRNVPFHVLKDIKQHIQTPTTDYRSILDHIYTNIVGVETGVFESYFSDHKPIWIKLNRNT